MRSLELSDELRMVSPEKLEARGEHLSFDFYWTVPQSKKF